MLALRALTAFIPSYHKAPRGGCSRERNPGPGLQDGQAVLGGALRLTDSVMTQGRWGLVEGPVGAEAWRSD